MNISDVFKNINVKAYTDEIGKIASEAKQGASKRVGGLLQMRKKLFKEKKQEVVEKMVEKEVNKMQQEQQTEAEQDSKVKSEATDASKTATGTDEAKDATSGTQEQPSEESTKEPEQPSEPKISAMTRLKTRMSSTGEAINQKAPFLYKSGSFIKELWKETFPNDSNKVKSRIGRRKEVAQMQQKYTEEELEEMQESIPEWKRTAVTMVDEDEVEKKEAGYLRRLTRKVTSKISDTSIAKSISESEEYREFRKKYREVKQESEMFKEDLKEEVETAQNPVVGGARSLGDYVLSDTTLGLATGKMIEYDPEFDVNDLHYEVEEIFTDMFDSYLKGDLEYLEHFCGDAALAVIKTELQRRK